MTATQDHDAKLEAIAGQCGDVDAKRLKAHLARLDDEYLRCFDAAAAAAHVKHLAALDAKQPVAVALEDLGDGAARCTVFAFDHPFEFSLITGVLAGTGFAIDSGDVFTLSKAAAPRTQRRGSRPMDRRRLARRAAAERHGLRSAVIIDRFTGQMPDDVSFKSWATRVKFSLTEVVTLLDHGDEASVAKAKQHVNELVTRRLARLAPARGDVLLPIEIDIEQAVDATRLTIVAQDTPAFLYSLATALSLHGLSIQRVRIDSQAERISDVIDVVDDHGRAITDPALQEAIKLSVLLTKQFTYFLDSSPDPFKALTRFERLAEDITSKPNSGQWTELLSDTRTMRDLAKLLGTSDYLWEEFIREQYEALLPVFAAHLSGSHFSHHPETMPVRMRDAIAKAKTFDDKVEALNAFKDAEIFRIDLDHILSPSVDFRELSTRLTLLAENLVAEALQLAYDRLVEKHGEPRDADGERCQFAAFGLGKLGGIALGYASDIELLFIYEFQGRTAGKESVTNREFFIQVAQDFTQIIHAKREGIFETDMRLRPYGKQGALASSLEQFDSYYQPGGPAHPFERIALVRLRWIAGDSGLGYAVEKHRDEYIYQNHEIDLPTLLETWDKQRQQKLAAKPGRRNAKYSPGALTDLEGTLQLLQVEHAHKVPQLRTPRLSGVMEALRRARVIDAAEYADLVGAYHFLRKLINALRVVRGNAQDLFLPKAESDEFLHLARRMDYPQSDGASPAQQLEDEFKRRTEAVRAFVKKRYGRD